MSQITSGVRAILSHPALYSGFQWIMGGYKRHEFVEDFIKPKPGMKILDIGCGPAAILEHLHDVEYFGYDISEAYIQQASARFAGRGKFFRKVLTQSDLDGLPRFDLVLGLGLLHHLDNADAIDFMKLSSNALNENGKLLTVDPCFVSSQNPIARFLIRHDRGQNVRSLDGYTEIATQVFPNTRAVIRHQAWIPYTHCIMECIR